MDSSDQSQAKCPDCGSVDLRFGSSDMVNQDLRDVAICNACGRVFMVRCKTEVDPSRREMLSQVYDDLLG